jgi:hypothetical protein
MVTAVLTVAAASTAKTGDTVKVCFKKACVRAEIADTDASRIRGLMFREKLEPGTGMLFIFPIDARHSFWMQNMRCALDIIWIDRDKTVVDIEPAAQPCTQSDCQSLVPRTASRYVLEAAAGFTKKHRIKTGDQVEFIVR